MSGFFSGVSLGAAETWTAPQTFRPAIAGPAILSRDASTPDNPIIVKPLGDGSNGLINWEHDDAAGYLLHFVTGPNMGATALIGLGIDHGGQGLLANNKATGNGIYLQQSSTVSGSTAYAFYGRQFNSLAPLIHLDQNEATDAPLISMWGAGAPWLAEWFSDAGVTRQGGVYKGATLVAGASAGTPSGQLHVAGSFAEQVWEFTNYAADSRRWRFTANGTNGEAYFSAVNDAMSGEVQNFTLQRDGGVRFMHNIGFYNHAAAAQATIAGSRGGNAALASLLTALAATGLIVDGTTA